MVYQRNIYNVYILLISQGVLPLWGVKQGRGEKNKTFSVLTLNVSISKTVGDTSKVTIND